MKKLLLITCTVLLFVSCMTENKAVGWLESHDKLPGVCAAKYPPVDSVGDIFFLPNQGVWKESDMTITPYYIPQWDSLEHQGATLLDLLEQKRRQADSISNECADVVISFMRQVDSLQRKIVKLRAGYKPPKDTVAAVQPHYNLNPPSVAAANQKVIVVDKALAKTEGERDAYKKWFIISIIIAVAEFLIGCFIFIYQISK